MSIEGGGKAAPGKSTGIRRRRPCSRDVRTREARNKHCAAVRLCLRPAPRQAPGATLRGVESVPIRCRAYGLSEKRVFGLRLACRGLGRAPLPTGRSRYDAKQMPLVQADRGRTPRTRERAISHGESISQTGPKPPGSGPRWLRAVRLGAVRRAPCWRIAGWGQRVSLLHKSIGKVYPQPDTLRVKKEPSWNIQRPPSANQSQVRKTVHGRADRRSSLPPLRETLSKIRQRGPLCPRCVDFGRDLLYHTLRRRHNLARADASIRTL